MTNLHLLIVSTCQLKTNYTTHSKLLCDNIDSTTGPTVRLSVKSAEQSEATTGIVGMPSSATYCLLLQPPRMQQY